MNLLCQSGFSNDDGVCATPIRKSLNKGKKCLQDRDCKTNIPGNTAKCKCGINPWGMKVCDIAEGDEEWQKALNSFKEYYEESKDCSPGMKWKKCKHTNSYYKMKCDGLKARFYPWFIGHEELDECMQNLPKSLPIFKEISQACLKAFAFPKVSMSFASVLITIILILTF